jgi:hypothetical protein
VKYYFVGGPLHDQSKDLEIREFFTFTVEESENLFEITPKITQHTYRAYGDLMIYVEKEKLN